MSKPVFCRARLIEVTPDKEIVFDMWIEDTGPDPMPLSAFRAEHFPGGLAPSMLWRCASPSVVQEAVITGLQSADLSTGALVKAGSRLRTA